MATKNTFVRASISGDYGQDIVAAYSKRQRILRRGMHLRNYSTIGISKELRVVEL